MNRTLIVLCSLLLSGCSSFSDFTLPDWMGGGKEPPLPGERVSVLADASALKTDTALEQVEVKLQAPEAVNEWPQDGQNAQSLMPHAAYNGSYHVAESASAGEGHGWEQKLVPSPVVAGGMIFSMDGAGYISARDAQNIGAERWVSKAAVEEDEPEMLGGGLAVADGVLYASTPFGRVIALSAQDGSERWRQSLGVALRGAPRVVGERLYVVGVDSQLFALGTPDGAIRWSHRGISETAGFVSMVTPAVSGDLVIAPYSSGEIFALESASGEERWSDTLLLPRRTSAASQFTGIDANPIIDGRGVFAVASGGIISATERDSGRRVWEQEISSENTPALSGDFMFIISSDAQLICLHAPSGRVKWVKQLERFEDGDKKKPILWFGPLLVDGRAMTVSDHGLLELINTANGSEAAGYDIPEGIGTMPVIASGSIYLVDYSGTLYALR